MSNLPATADAKSPKLVWNAHHDRGLVDCVLQLKELLRDPLRSYPRTKFWNAVCCQLRRKHGLACNSRQCRDRFNLLFSKALVHKVDRRSGYREPADRALDVLLTTCTETFYFSNGKSLELHDQRPNVATTPLPGATAAAIGKPASAPSISCYEAQQLHAELKTVRDALDDLSQEVAAIKDKVQHLQELQNLHGMQD